MCTLLCIQTNTFLCFAYFKSDFHQFLTLQELIFAVKIKFLKYGFGLVPSSNGRSGQSLIAKLSQLIRVLEKNFIVQ